MEGPAELQFRLATVLGGEVPSADPEITSASDHLPQGDELLEVIDTSDVVQEVKPQDHDPGNGQESVRYRLKTDLERIEHFHRVEFELQNAYCNPIKDRGDQALLANRTKEHRFLRSTTGRLDYDNWRRCNSERFNELAAEEIDKLENKEEYVAEADEIMRKLSAEYAKRDVQFEFTSTDSTGVDVLALL
ncbi:hypothetical protein PI124_g4344 [Phytophthora idaei]|nr:hypothetical protein PI125_g3272 [Phytophthora idaei]KAG3167486.1 hypothetical protein PI126_g3774 [Phytophthora idaei]KAG3251020.1 hypothetical protein PI124_g4344 [Phytophthora idaei]